MAWPHLCVIGRKDIVLPSMFLSEAHRRTWAAESPASNQVGSRINTLLLVLCYFPAVLLKSVKCSPSNKGYRHTSLPVWEHKCLRECEENFLFSFCEIPVSVWPQVSILKFPKLCGLSLQVV